MTYVLFIAGLLWFVFVLWRELKHDWKPGVVIDHSNGLVRRLFWLMPTHILWVVHAILGPPPEFRIIVLWAALLIIGLWWTLFDSIYNAHYNRPIFHVEKPHSNSAVTDKFLYPLPVIVRAIIKIGLIAVSAILYFKTW